jgi:hypothetical protein
MNPRHKYESSLCEPYEPSPKDIRRACERIQSGWSDRERTKRSGFPPEGRWMPPKVDWEALTEAAKEDQRGNWSPGSSVL